LVDTETFGDPVVVLESGLERQIVEWRQKKSEETRTHDDDGMLVPEIIQHHPWWFSAGNAGRSFAQSGL
jgi:hypothetical protein